MIFGGIGILQMIQDLGRVWNERSSPTSHLGMNIQRNSDTKNMGELYPWNLKLETLYLIGSKYGTYISLNIQ